MKYLYVRAWGKLLNSYPWYVEREVEKAKSENASETAIYRREDGSWAVFGDIENEAAKIRVAAMVEDMRKEMQDEI